VLSPDYSNYRGRVSRSSYFNASSRSLNTLTCSRPLITSPIKLLRADTLKQWPNVLLTCFERTLRQSHVTKHANHYHLSAKRPSLLNDLFGPSPANEAFEYCSQHDGPPGNGWCRAGRNPVASLLRGRHSEKT